ncbi:glycosyltransferase family 2 protein [Vibrio breoganii]|uniref:glycosyltransferase family 2 protein n=1 Tax=Vibrio breoganii TaxID=553239 RepID=UPI000C81F2A5|nr:glycosyltransferase family 2 protein [Vibrio breoganii]PMO34029.1 hypothetical protein BCT12_01475 [Vibrio breoganii]
MLNRYEKVSIITPSFKSLHYIMDCINSVHAQTYTNFEMLIVDDASPDDSAAYIERNLPDERFKLIKLKSNVGAAAARNEALRVASGRYIAFLDSDDIWYPSKLEKQLEFMTANNYSFTFTSYELIDEKGNRVQKNVTVPKEIDFKGYMGNTIIGCLTVIIDTKDIKPFLMPNLRSSHDMALWGDIMLDNDIKAYGLDEVLAYYRLVSTSNTSNKFKAAKEVWIVYRNHFKLSRFRSIFFFLSYAANALIKRL